MVKQTCFPVLAHVHVCVQSFSRVQLFVTPRTVARQAPLSMGFSRQKYWCGLPFPSPGDLPYPRIEPMSPTLAGRLCVFCLFVCLFLTIEPPGKPNLKGSPTFLSPTYNPLVELAIQLSTLSLYSGFIKSVWQHLELKAVYKRGHGELCLPPFCLIASHGLSL